MSARKFTPTASEIADLASGISELQLSSALQEEWIKNEKILDDKKQEVIEKREIVNGIDELINSIERSCQVLPLTMAGEAFKMELMERLQVEISDLQRLESDYAAMRKTLKDAVDMMIAKFNDLTNRGII